MLVPLLALQLFQAPAAAPAKPPAAPAAVEETDSITRHKIALKGRALEYTVTAGRMPLRDANGEIEAQMFYIAYVADREPSAPPRPLMFSFNGGPGSSSVWLHLGVIGPKRVKMQDDGAMPPPPYQLVDNEATWLDQTDLVFIDPVGTGYSRAVKPDQARRFFGLQGDIQSVGEFIRLYLARNSRFASPLFLVGESYGTTRAAGLSGYLVDKGIALNGVLLVSTILNFQTARFARGNDLPYQLFLPTYTATAWHHKKLPADLQGDLKKAVAESEAFALSGYAQALAKGDRLTAVERKAAIEKLARLTGLSETFIDNADLRVDQPAFCKELLRGRKLTVGRLDSRFTGIDATSSGERAEFDPSMTAIRPPYTAALNQYVRADLKYTSDLEYHILGGGITSPWDFGVNNGYADTSDALRGALARNPFMKVYVGAGYFDLATPHFAAEYTLAHMSLKPQQRENIRVHYYEAGHMYYIDTRQLARFRADVDAFLKNALAAR